MFLSATEDSRAPPTILFTCTTFLSLPGKLEQCLRALASIERVHSPAEFAKISRFLVINEYAPGLTRDLERGLKRAFPWVDFVQKGPDQAGQAASLNIILEQLGGVGLWIHWEESWVCRAPFIARAQKMMAHTDITQLQISEDIWSHMGADRLTCQALPAPEADTCWRVAPHPTFLQIAPMLSLETLPQLWNTHGLEVIWPLYSLRPSVNRAAFYPGLGRFDTRAHMWPHLFEWEFGFRWLLAGGQKAILRPEVAVRQVHHRSTHALVASGSGRA